MKKIAILTVLTCASINAAWAQSPFQTCNKKAMPFYDCITPKLAACEPEGGYVIIPQAEYCTINGGSVTCKKNQNFTPERKLDAEKKLAQQKSEHVACRDKAANSCDANLAKFFNGWGIDMAKCTAAIKNGSYTP